MSMILVSSVSVGDMHHCPTGTSARYCQDPVRRNFYPNYFILSHVLSPFNKHLNPCFFDQRLNHPDLLASPIHKALRNANWSCAPAHVQLVAFKKMLPLSTLYLLEYQLPVHQMPPAILLPNALICDPEVHPYFITIWCFAMFHIIAKQFNYV